MKVCKLCGETYRDHVDFCFVDGEVLAERPAPFVGIDPVHLEAPDPSRLGITPDGEPRYDLSVPTRSATPMPRSRRSLLQRATPPPSASATPPPPRTAAEEKMTPTPVMAERQDEPAPTPLTPDALPRAAAPAAEQAWFEAEVFESPDLTASSPRRTRLVLGAVVLALLVVVLLLSNLLAGEDARPDPTESAEQAAVQTPPELAPSKVETTPAAEPPEEAAVEDEGAAIRTAPVRFDTTPSGALVTVGGKPEGRTPLKLDLPLGDHEIRVELDGYQPLLREIEVSPGENLVPTWTLLPLTKAPEPSAALVEPAEGSADPAPAEVPVYVGVAGQEGAVLRVDGELVGPLPVEITLLEGVHVFEVEGPGGTFRVRREVRASSDGGRVELQLGR